MYSNTDEAVRESLRSLMYSYDTSRTVRTPCACALLHYDALYGQRVLHVKTENKLAVRSVCIVLAVDAYHAHLQRVLASSAETFVLDSKRLVDVRTHCCLEVANGLLAAINRIAHLQIAHSYRTEVLHAKLQLARLALHNSIFVSVGVEHKVEREVVARDSCLDSKRLCRLALLCSVVLPAVAEVSPAAILRESGSHA